MVFVDILICTMPNLFFIFLRAFINNHLSSRESPTQEEMPNFTYKQGQLRKHLKYQDLIILMNSFFLVEKIKMANVFFNNLKSYKRNFNTAQKDFSIQIYSQIFVFKRVMIKNFSSTRVSTKSLLLINFV